MIASDEQTLKELEFNVIKDWLSKQAISDSAQEILEAIEPIANFTLLQEKLAELEEFHRIRTEGESFPGLTFQELLKEIKILPIQNAVLTQEGCMRIHRASELVNAILYFFNKREVEYPTLTKLLSSVNYTEELIVLIEKVFDKKGFVKDDASPKLYEIRQQLQVVRNQIAKNFEKELRRYTKEGYLGENRETFVNERRVLAVVSTHKRKVSGSVLGSSKTGSLTYIEPQINIELNNEFELLQDDERNEIFKILQALTRDLSQHFDLISAYQILLVAFDVINSKCKLALDMNAILPGISEEPKIELIEAYHPILYKNNLLSGKKTIPQTIIMDKFSRMLVISGPNAGGKSITLKTIGLMQVMLQSGLLIPVHPNSKVGFFQHILSDIGDNQSIENELSTYSHRLKRMKNFLDISNRRTLLLLDEFGTGSDPELGGALAEVFFERLYARKCFGVITTHYGNIKLKADRLQNACNGCMLFETETLEPLYKFSIGQPGSSFTFEVAQINGIPQEVIEEAKSKVSTHKVEMDKLLSELQREKTYLERLNQEHIEAQELALRKQHMYEDKEKQLALRTKQFQLNVERDNKFVIAGKKLMTFIDRYKSASKKKDANKALLDDVKKYLSVEKAKIEEAQVIEKMKSLAKVKKPKAKKEMPEVDPYQREKIVLGSTVKLIDTKKSGQVEAIDGKNLVVSFGFLRLKVEREKLMFVK